MKQIVNNFKTGKLQLIEVPSPVCQEGGILIKTVHSVVSVGTEKMMIELAKKSLLNKAKERPDQVRQVIDKVKKEGLIPTYKKVMNLLDEPKPLGYSCSGTVIEVGINGGNFQVGDRVACAGAGYANHAEYNFVPKNLAVKIPSYVSFEDAAYTTLGAIALQGVRQADPNLGDVVFVMGLGILGLISAQILIANGCTVICSDTNPARVKLAKKLGFDHAFRSDHKDLMGTVKAITHDQGVDAIIIAASSKSNEPIELAAELSRHKGKVVVVGMVAMDIPRNAYYLKELDLRLSMSYGPGRYDTQYEENGQDYPYAYVRWTEQRNMQAILSLISQNKLDIKSLTTHKYKFDKAEEVYEKVVDGKENFLGVLFEYDKKRKAEQFVKLDSIKIKKTINLGLIGAGNYASSMLYPHIKEYRDVNITGIATATGISAEDKAKKYKAHLVTTDYCQLLKNKDINVVFITTRHNLHAEQIVAAMEHGKHVFVEKPIALSLSELNLVKRAYQKNKKILMVGYNRRYSPLTMKLLSTFLEKNSPMNILYRVNAGFIPRDHWVQDPGQGGGRIIGEVCHFIDYLIYLTGSIPVEVFAQSLAVDSEDQVVEDNISAVFRFKNGSIGTIIYSAQGSSAMEKEYIEIFSHNKSAKLTDFRELKIYDDRKSKRIKLAKQDKGQANEIKYFFDLIRGNIQEEYSFYEIYIGSLATFKILESLRKGKPVPIDL